MSRRDYQALAAVVAWIDGRPRPRLRSRRAENPRLGLSTTMRSVRTAPLATKCLRWFTGQPAIPAMRLPDEAQISSPTRRKVGGKSNGQSTLPIGGWEEGLRSARLALVGGSQQPPAGLAMFSAPSI